MIVSLAMIAMMMMMVVVMMMSRTVRVIVAVSMIMKRMVASTI